MREVVIVGACRTALGAFQSSLAAIPAPKLGAAVIAEVVKRAKLSSTDVGEVFMGCVLPAGLGQAPARQAAIFGGLDKSTPCTTVNKVCGSGLKAIMLGAQAIATGDQDIVVAGGMESMSNVPYYLPAARAGMRLGNSTVVDGLVHDGLWDVYNQFHMGTAADKTAREKNIDRASQDAFAAESYQRARAAQASGAFREEIVGVEVPQRKGPALLVNEDEGPSRGDIEKLPTLKAAFSKEGSVTAGNASTINDGAAAVALCAKEIAEKRGLPILGTFKSFAQAAQEPEWFTTAPAVAIARALERAKLSKDEIDLYEINEAFAVVSLVNNQLLGLDAKKVNVNGGAIALGHPIGASGARLVVTLVHALKARGLKRGCASLCIGGGEAIAAVIG